MQELYNGSVSNQLNSIHAKKSPEKAIFFIVLKNKTNNRLLVKGEKGFSFEETCLPLLCRTKAVVPCHAILRESSSLPLSSAK